MGAYTTYLTQVRRLLHDANDQFWPASEKLDYINLARQRVVRDSGCYRVLQQGFISPGNEVNVFGGVTGVSITSGGSGFTNGTYALGLSGGGGTGAAGTYTVAGNKVVSAVMTSQGVNYTSPPAVSFPSGGGVGAAGVAGIIHASTFDVVNLTIFWGNSRIVPAYLPWSQFNAQARYYVNYTGRPTVFSVYSNNSVFVQPIPDQTYQVEWDSVLIPPSIIDDTTAEVIPFPFQDPVPFYACHLAKLKEQSRGEAALFMQDYQQQIGASHRSSFTRRIRNPYGGA